jgi:hypothetical protein
LNTKVIIKNNDFFPKYLLTPVILHFAGKRGHFCRKTNFGSYLTVLWNGYDQFLYGSGSDFPKLLAKILTTFPGHLLPKFAHET